MKTLLALTAAVFFLGGCGDDSVSLTEPELELPNGSMSARIDGQAWTANAALAVAYTGGILAFAGSDVTSTTVGLGFIPDGLGTYDIGPNQPTNANVSLGSPNSWAASSNMGSGSVTLTSFTENSASGTFTFTALAVPTTGATGTKVVTEGRFDVTF